MGRRGLSLFKQRRFWKIPFLIKPGGCRAAQSVNTLIICYYSSCSIRMIICRAVVFWRCCEKVSTTIYYPPGRLQAIKIWRGAQRGRRHSKIRRARKVKKSLICLQGKLMTPFPGNTIMSVPRLSVSIFVVTVLTYYPMDKTSSLHPTIAPFASSIILCGAYKWSGLKKNVKKEKMHKAWQ